MAVLILLNKMPPVKNNFDYMNKNDLDEIWFKVRDTLKD